ncbi:MAG TPA: DoxX family protein [bacterium]|nr:DoxX family protein [bacterium]
MNVLVWIVQVLLAVQFLFHGWLFISPPPMMADAIGMLGLSAWFRQFIGVAEVLAAIGLIGPGLTRTFLPATPLAALGLTIVMVSATIFHIVRNEIPNAISALNLLLLVVVTGYVRWRVVPLQGHSAR